MKLISTAEAAEKLGVHITRVQVLIRQGRLPAQKVGPNYVVNEVDLKLVADRKPGRPPKQAAPVPPTSKGEIRHADKTARELDDALRKAAEGEQQTGKKRGGKKPRISPLSGAASRLP